MKRKTPPAKQLSGLLTDRGLGILIVIQFFAGIVTTPVLTFLPVYVDEVLGLEQSFTANARAIWLAAMGLSALAGGALSDAVGRKFTIVLGLAGTVAGALIFVNGSPLLVGYLLPIVLGTADGLYITASQTYLVEVSPRNRLSTMTALWFSGMTGGNLVGGLIGGAVAEWAGYTTLSIYIAISSVTVASLALAVLPSIGDGRLVTSLRFRTTLASYISLLQQTPYQLLIAIQVLRTFFWGGFQIMGPIMIAGISGSKFVVGLFVAATTGVGLVSMLLAGAFSDRQGRRGTILVTLCGTAAGSVLISLTTHNLIGLFAAGTLAAAFAWAMSGQMTPLAKELSQPRESGRAMALVNAPWSIAALGGAQIGGRMVADQPSEAFWIFGGLALTAFLCALTLFHYFKQPRP